MQKSDLDQLRAHGCTTASFPITKQVARSFLKLFEDARTSNEVMFLDLLANEMQRFLPIGGNVYAFDDVIGVAIGEFRRWLEEPERSELRLDIALTMADYLIRKERPNTAIELLTGISEPQADHERRYRLAIQRGIACMRIPGQMDNALHHFRLALAAAEAQTSDDRYKLIAKAHKELGFYYRNAGMWQVANGTYRSARDR